MSKFENPFSSILNELDESLSLHKIESLRISRDVLESGLEEKVKKYVNDPKVTEIRAKRRITEEDQGYLDINIFSSSYHKNKLELAKSFEREYKKFIDLIFQLKDTLEERASEFELNSTLLSKFTKEELEKNPKLSKMISKSFEGADVIKKKFIKADTNLTQIYSDYISRNNEDFAEKLYDFLDESKRFRKQFSQNKQPEIDEFKDKIEDKKTTGNSSNIFGKSQEEFNKLREEIINNENVSSDVIENVKNLVSKVFNPRQLMALNSFEKSLNNEYAKSNNSKSILKKRLNIALSQFNKGVSEIDNLLIATKATNDFRNSISALLNSVYGRKIDEVKNDSAYLYEIIGYACGIKKYIDDNTIETRKGNLKIKDKDVNAIVQIHFSFTKYLINDIGVDQSILNYNMLRTMITSDKLDELAFTLTNNVSSISNSINPTNWEEGVNKIVALCIVSMVSAIEANKSAIEVVERFNDQYLSKEVVLENNNEEVRYKRSYMTREDQALAIKKILE